MMATPIPVNWQITESSLLKSIQWASKKFYYSIDRLNMNSRGVSERLDDKIMGDSATLAMIEYLRSAGIDALAYDEIRIDSFTNPDLGWDFIFGKNVKQLGQDFGVIHSLGLLTTSVRSSRLPRTDSLETAIQTRDFKVFALPNRSLEECFTADIETQVYYEYTRTQLGSHRVRLSQIEACAQGNSNGDDILLDLHIKERFGDCYLTAWNNSTDIIAYLHSLPINERYWNSFQKRMLVAPLRMGKDVRELAVSK